MKGIGYDKRPRFGWVSNLDDDPQIVSELKTLLRQPAHPVVVIPLPYLSAKLRRKIREFTDGSIWPKA